MALPRLVTVVGGSGFIGRQIVQDLARRGIKVRVAVRDPERALDLKPLGDVGQITPIQTNIRNADSLRAAVRGADAVVNLVGILAEGGKQTFEAVQAQGPGLLAAAAAEEGVASFVHVSAIGASAESKSIYARTKAAGEKAVLSAFPDAVILRPSVVFGPRDDFFNRFADLARKAPALPLIGGGKTRFQPVYVGDVAQAAVEALTRRDARGKTYELGGPQIFTFKELMQLVLKETGQKAMLLPLPFAVASLMGRVMGLLPKPPLTADQVTLLKSDNVVTGNYPGLQRLGVTPTAANAVLPGYMDIYRKGGRFSEQSRA